MKITGRHLTVTPALRRYVRGKLERLERYGVPTDRVQVVLEVNKLQHAAEAVCSIGGRRFLAKTSTPEMYATIDQLIGRLEAQIRKHKERRTQHKSRETRKAKLAEAIPAPQEDIEVVRPRVSILSRETAMHQLEHEPGSILVFTCEDSGKLQILRRGENGKIVLIDP